VKEENQEELAELIRQMLLSGKLDAESMSKLASLTANPTLMAAILSESRFMMEEGEAVNWEMAREQAMKFARSTAPKTNPQLEVETKKAFEMAALWLQEVTDFSNPNPTKFYTRELWVEDALPLYTKLGNPIAENMSKALGGHLQSLLPEQLHEMIKPATQFIRNAGAAIFATQLGDMLGKLSTQTVFNGEMGIPIIERPGIVTANLENFLENLETPKSELLIYIALKELALSSLYHSNRWLSEQIVTQIMEFASGMTVELSGLQQMVQEIDPTDPEAVEKVMEASGNISSKTPEQELALKRIETLLALIDGFVDAIAAEAGKRLPSIASAIEMLNRKRVTDAPAERTFRIIIGLQSNPKLRRDAKLMWERLTKEQRDEIWSHPDQLPTREEIEDPDKLVARLNQGGDDFDGELRKLLGN
jgi:putative hydrolase